jgi:hypothetical protein
MFDFVWLNRGFVHRGKKIVLGKFWVLMPGGFSGGNGWESNPPRLATRPDTDFEDREAHQDLTIPVVKNNFDAFSCQLIF